MREKEAKQLEKKNWKLKIMVRVMMMRVNRYEKEMRKKMMVKQGKAIKQNDSVEEK